jgi:hypothetical protein
MCKLNINLENDSAEELRKWEISHLKRALADLNKKPEQNDDESDFEFEERLGTWLCDRDRRLKSQFIKNYISSLENAIILIAGEDANNG